MDIVLPSIRVSKKPDLGLHFDLGFDLSLASSLKVASHPVGQMRLLDQSSDQILEYSGMRS